jgi:hypothetical protein
LALLAGVCAAAALLVGARADLEQFFRSYLFGFLFWAGIALGSMALVMLHNLTGGGWGLIIRRCLESGMRTMPLVAVLSVPILLGLSHLYVWARPEAVAADELLRHKSAYLNPAFFIVRTAVYFAAWLLLAWMLTRGSLAQDRSSDPGIGRRLRMVSGPGLVVYGLTVTFASVDWVMSLEPHWFSTIYGMLFMVGQGLATLALALVVTMLLREREALARVITKGRLQDLGNLMLAFVMLWAYISFSQFLIVWSGNLPEEIEWYQHRLHGGWMVAAFILVVFHFAAPFVVLLSRDVKRKARVLGTVAAGILVVRLVDLYWIIGPGHGDAGLHLHWQDIVAPVAVGGLWLEHFLRRLQSWPLVPLHHPELELESTHE